MKGGIFWSQTTWTAPDGRFVLDDVAPDERLKILARGYAGREMVPIELKPEETTFVLARELAISGQVLRLDGNPLPEPVTVSASIEDVSGATILAQGVGSSMGAQTDGEGRFRIPGLTAGPYTLRVHSFRSDLGWEPMTRVAAGTTDIVLREKQPQFVAGSVVDENDRPLRGARVNLHDVRTGEFVKGGQVDDQGRFRVPVPTGKYEARVNLAGMAFRRVRDVEAGRDDLVLRFAAGAEIRGQIGSAEGYASRSGSVEVWSDAVHGYAEVDASGAFAIRGLPPGTYEIKAIGAARGGGEVLRGTARAEAGANGVRIELK